MLSLKTKIDDREIEKFIVEAQLLVDGLIEHDKDFTKLVYELTEFYKVSSCELLERMVTNLSQYNLSEGELDFDDLKSIAKLSALSILMPALKPLNASYEFRASNAELMSDLSYEQLRQVG